MEVLPELCELAAAQDVGLVGIVAFDGDHIGTLDPGVPGDAGVDQSCADAALGDPLEDGRLMNSWRDWLAR
jgi:hypothetical protein